MNKFTSHIDFSLTKKRFKMMMKEHSTFRSGFRGIILLPLLVAFSLMFCDVKKESGPTKVTPDNDIIYTNIDLYVDNDKADALAIEKRGMGVRFDSAGNPFTGRLEYRHSDNDSLRSRDYYRDGIIVKSVSDVEGMEYTYEYGYIADHFRVVKHINGEGDVVEQWKDAGEGELGYQRTWYANGQMEFEMYFKEGLEYEGLMTYYSPAGNILKQERYEDGELVETIR